MALNVKKQGTLSLTFSWQAKSLIPNPFFPQQLSERSIPNFKSYFWRKLNAQYES